MTEAVVDAAANGASATEAEIARIVERRRSSVAADTRPLRGLHGWLRFALYACLVLGLMHALLSGTILWSFLRSEEGGMFADLIIGLAYWLYDAGDWPLRLAKGFAFAACAFLFLRFIHRASWNLENVRAAGDRMPPIWAVAYNFIPVLSLWKPHQVMRQLWRSSVDPRRAEASPPITMWVWWLTWLVALWAMNASARALWSGGDVYSPDFSYGLFIRMIVLDLASYSFLLVSVLALLPVLRRITEAQDARRSQSPG